MFFLAVFVLKTVFLLTKSSNLLTIVAWRCIVKNSFLSLHALDRVKERLHLSMEEILFRLDHDLFVPLGHEPKNHRHHRLFYSPIDDLCFVAVQDVRNGEVITIMPPDFRCGSWYIPPKAHKMAKELWDRHLLPDGPPSLAALPDEVTIRTYTVRFMGFTELNGEGRAIRLCDVSVSFPEGTDKHPLPYILEPRIIQLLRDQVTRNERYGPPIQSISFRVNKQRPVQWFPMAAITRTQGENK